MLVKARQVLRRPDIHRRSIIVAAVVGTILNAINQGTDILGGESVQWYRCMLTYMVPYCVSLYSCVATVCREDTISNQSHTSVTDN
ncbi:hypothetical protein AB833_31100 [Chromatiales bacterium (ex Bugula neritina AB1)]|nr:hypothetical protein AB833_31100 [Chromatiales bacterium (ex Bugula neritina AB1)]